MSQEEYPELYLQGIEHFNDRDFFEAHEVWEELWTDDQGPSRRFFQGLIQAAVALHHFGNGNLRGARKLNVSCRKYLDPYRPKHLGLDLDAFLGEMDECFAEAMDNPDEPLEIEIDPQRIPDLRLDPPPERGA